jgi:hypothetical protein
MLKHKQKYICLRSALSDAPLTPTAVNAEIARNGESSVAIKAIKERSQAYKNNPTSSLLQIIEQQT